MHKLTRLAELKREERLLLLRAFCVVAFVRLALCTLRVSGGRRAIAKIARIGRKVSVRQVAWAVRTASQCIPGATCLTQALAVQALLCNCGYDSRIVIGVAKDSGSFKAHAWVVHENEIVIGGPDVTTYAHLTDLGAVLPADSLW